MFPNFTALGTSLKFFINARISNGFGRVDWGDAMCLQSKTNTDLAPSKSDYPIWNHLSPISNAGGALADNETEPAAQPRDSRLSGSAVGRQIQNRERSDRVAWNTRLRADHDAVQNPDETGFCISQTRDCCRSQVQIVCIPRHRVAAFPVLNLWTHATRLPPAPPGRCVPGSEFVRPNPIRKSR